MDFKLDAFPVDDTVGGLRSTEKIKIMICYLLRDVGEAFPRDALRSALYDNGIANYFEISQAIDDLLDVGAICLTDGDNLTLNDKGDAIARELEDELSVYIRNKAVRAVRLTEIYEKRKKENEVTITKIHDKRYRLTVTMHSGLARDGETDELMQLSLYVTDAMQAETMKQSFLNNPVKLYEKVVEGLTDDPTFQE